ncbi:MAG: hypothetical protein U9P36_07670, partial [Thermodesulfobacteriota bacterium]|nr:hypothetical protein [Thermodesulfobacteriota bacterium]
MKSINNNNSTELQEKSLHAEKSADIIQQIIGQKRIAEANRLFQESVSVMKKDDREKISKQLSALLEEAEEYFREADTLETERKLEQAHEKYKQVENIAIDYPELPESLRRIEDAITLIQALEQRVERRTNRQEKQSGLLTQPSHSGQHRGWLALLACFSLILIMIGAGLFYTHNRNATLAKKTVVQQVVPLEKDDLNIANKAVRPAIKERFEQPESQRKKKDTTTTLRQQTQKNALPKKEPAKQQESLKQAEQITSSEIKNILSPAPEKQIFQSVPAPIEEDRHQKLSDLYTGSTREERAASLTEPQLTRKESLSPVPISSLQMEKTIGETNSAEEGFSIHQDIRPSADTARKSEKTMGEPPG